MRKCLKEFLREEAGASAVEYGLIAALIAAIIILAVEGLGLTLNGLFTSASSATGSASGS